MTKEIIKKESNEAVLAKFSEGYEQGQGAIANIDNSSIQLGQICLAQGLSQAVADEAVKVGDIYDFNGNEVLAAKGEKLEIIVVDYKKAIAIHKILDGGKKEWVENRIINPINPFKFEKEYQENGQTFQMSTHHQFIVLIPGRELPYRLTIKGLSIPASSKLLTEMRILDGKRVPFYAQVFELSVIDKQTDNGKFKAYHVEKGRVVTDEEFEVAKLAVTQINQLNSDMSNAVDSSVKGTDSIDIDEMPF